MAKGRAKKYKRRHVAGRSGRQTEEPAGSWEIWGTRIEETTGPVIFGGAEQRSRGAGGFGGRARSRVQYSDSDFRAVGDCNIQCRADNRVHEIWKSRWRRGAYEAEGEVPDGGAVNSRADGGRLEAKSHEQVRTAAAMCDDA